MDAYIRLAAGAEAEVFETSFLGRDAVAKVRSPKGYRHPRLDASIRSARTRNEVRLMRDARYAGVRTPIVYDVDVEACTVIMERVRGQKLKDALDLSDDCCGICASIGRTIAMLHDAGICHGDLTTSNMILTEGGEICLIDFSMGKSAAATEDLGVDVRLLEKAFASAHPGLGDAYAALIGAYMKKKKHPEEIMKKLEEIKNRGRYT
ncbi:MAG: Kae1-associated serine/threonine protein kinase [Candidatus Methanoplasma sp.]|jgi:TP53 regulating kinase-like protein/N6-L-threonylcarbamoyladenine synthase/protein kinase Bud32|nr:Kae1-associated serine/threonine protein kinase [Candidatus Methanoplasma sp.]